MKKVKLMLGGVALAALASTALAGGEPVATEYKDVVVPPAPMWTGYYAGLNAGWGWGTESVKQTGDASDMQSVINAGTVPASTAGDPDGFLGGAQLGYNHQSSQSVFGIEADFQGADIKESQTTTVSTYTTKVEQQLDYLGTLRARLGILPDNPWLLFVTGGMAYGQTKLSANITDTAGVFTGSKSTTEHPVGWTAGGGFEYMFAPNWFAKGEYLYYDLGDHTQRTLTASGATPWVDQKVDFKGHVGRAGINYRFWP